MSGGHFDYQQFRLTEIAGEIEDLIKNNKIKDDWGCCYNFSNQTIKKFEKALYKFVDELQKYVSTETGEWTIKGFIDIFKKLFGANWSDRLEHVLRYTTLALLDSPNTTILSILKMLTDKNYRQKIISRIKDSVVKNFWVSEFAAWSEKFDAEAITPLLNKVGQLVSTNMIRNIIGQPKSGFNFSAKNLKIFSVDRIWQPFLVSQTTSPKTTGTKSFFK